MAQQFLNRADVIAVLQQVSGKAVAQGVRRCRFGDASLLYRALERALEGLVLQVVAAHQPAARIGRMVILREHPEPGPGGAHARVLAIQGVWHLHAGGARVHIARPHHAGLGKLLSQGRRE